MIELAPEPLVADVERLRGALRAPGRRRAGAGRPPPPALQQLLDAQPPGAGQGAGRCTLHVHPDDAERSGWSTASRPSCGRGRARSPPRSRSPTRSCPAWSASRTAGATTPTAPACRWPPRTPGPNSNVLADERLFDAVSGNAVLNGIPVELAPVNRGCRRRVTPPGMHRKLIALIAAAAALAAARARRRRRRAAHGRGARCRRCWPSRSVPSTAPAGRRRCCCPGRCRLTPSTCTPAAAPDGFGYDLELGALRDCGGADACFVADVQRRQGPHGVRQACSRPRRVEGRVLPAVLRRLLLAAADRFPRRRHPLHDPGQPHQPARRPGRP